MTTIPCSACGKLFKRYKSAKYCSDDCRNSIVRPRAYEYDHAKKLKKLKLTLNDYQDMFEKQGGLCAICGSPETQRVKGTINRLSVDHCHQTGKVRGLLCGSCNLGIGKFKDNWVLVENAMEYLQSSDCRNGIFARSGTR